MTPIKYIDLFAGVSGFRFAMQAVTAELGTSAFSSEIDRD